MSSATVCAGPIAGATSVGACTGDDGGPLSVNMGTAALPNWVLSGIALSGTVGQLRVCVCVCVRVTWVLRLTRHPMQATSGVLCGKAESTCSARSVSPCPC